MMQFRIYDKDKSWGMHVHKSLIYEVLTSFMCCFIFQENVMQKIFKVAVFFKWSKNVASWIFCHLHGNTFCDFIFLMISSAFVKLNFFFQFSTSFESHIKCLILQYCERSELQLLKNLNFRSKNSEKFLRAILPFWRENSNVI